MAVMAEIRRPPLLRLRFTARLISPARLKSSQQPKNPQPLCKKPFKNQINKIIDFKTRLLTQLDQQNRLKNAQYLGIGLPEHKPIPATNPVNQGSRGSNAGSAGRDNDSGDNSTTTELPPFDREKVALQIPNTFVGPAFNVVNGASQIIGNVLQVYHHPLNHHPLNHRPLNHHPLNHHPLNHHPLNHHPLNHHPSNHHPSNHHPLNHHPLNHHPLNHHPLNHHPLNHHPLNHHPLNHHPLNHHPLNHHPLNHHPLKNHKTPQDQWQGVNDSSLSISTHLKL
ncbi:uncharacterized protein [Bemisia tabaci]|uniref:uncharacterized protein isoform X4 n=1 Tax=Bemisia tabaci TaxID=7038 RepID=UPI003B28C5BA